MYHIQFGGFRRVFGQDELRREGVSVPSIGEITVAASNVAEDRSGQKVLRETAAFQNGSEGDYLSVDKLLDPWDCISGAVRSGAPPPSSVMVIT